jgi:hypothetical protein
MNTTGVQSMFVDIITYGDPDDREKSKHHRSRSSKLNDGDDIDSHFKMTFF